MFEQVIKLIGKPLNDPDLQAFMVEHGFKQPKKAEISGRSSDRSFWVEHKKLGINLLFDIETQNQHNPPFVGSKKGMWLPMLQQITFANPNLNYPFGLKIGLTHDETTKILGNFTFKSSDIHKVWLNDDGSESFYGWTKTIDAAKDIVLHTRINVGEKICDIDIHPARFDSVFYLYDVFNNETIDNTLAGTATLHEMAMFMEWAIQKDMYVGAAHLANITAKVKSGSSNGIDFLRQHTHCGRIFKEDFAPNAQEFVRQYGNNMSGHDILYSRDYVLSFLTNAKQRDNYMGEDAIETLKKVAYSDENKAKIFGVLDIRFAEFNAHGFAKSTVELKS
jgi:hypothetical protein